MSRLTTKWPGLAKYRDSLKFAFHCMSHPVDGFWDLTHEHRGSMAVANTILIATLLTRIFTLRYASFIFVQVNWEETNIILYIASILFPLALWVIGNWGCTTLFDGKGKLSSIYIASCYSLLPYPVVEIPLIILSNLVTKEEASFISVVDIVVLVYAGMLFIVSMSQIHEFSFWKNLLFVLLSLLAMLIIVFILMVFFSMIAQGIGYFISIGKELIFRF